MDIARIVSLFLMGEGLIRRRFRSGPSWSGKTPEWESKTSFSEDSTRTCYCVCKELETQRPCHQNKIGKFVEYTYQRHIDGIAVCIRFLRTRYCCSESGYSSCSFHVHHHHHKPITVYC